MAGLDGLYCIAEFVHTRDSEGYRGYFATAIKTHHKDGQPVVFSETIHELADM
jgi:hypothetical protein